MTNCTLQKHEKRYWCPVCDPKKQRLLLGNYTRNCKLFASSSTHGVGYHLKLLLARFHLLGKAGCGCNAHATQMDRNGPDWCAANIDTIVGRMRDEAKKRRLPFTAIGAKLLIRLAICNARRDAASATIPPLS